MPLRAIVTSCYFTRHAGRTSSVRGLAALSTGVTQELLTPAWMSVSTDNIALVPDYYQRRRLSFVLGERDALLAAFRRHNAPAEAAAGGAVP